MTAREIAQQTAYQAFQKMHAFWGGQRSIISLNENALCDIITEALTAYGNEQRQAGIRQAAEVVRRADNSMLHQDKLADHILALLDAPPEESPSMNDALDAARYRRLRVLGCAPAETKQLENSTVMRFQNLDDYIDEDIKRNPSRGEYRPASPEEER